jgi:hypothetical protein
MPIWAIVLTQLVALYGAVLSTLNFLRAGPKLRLTVQTGVVVNPWGSSGGPATIVKIEVTNYGDRPTTLTSMTARYFERRLSWERLRNRATRESPLHLSAILPSELTSGSVWGGYAKQAQFTDGGGAKGVWYFYLHHSHSSKPLRKRVQFKSTPPDP